MTVILSMIAIVVITRLTTRIIFLEEEEKNRKAYIRKVEENYQKIMKDEAHYD